MAPSRRRVLELAGLGLAGSVGTALVAGGPTAAESSALDWPMSRYDPEGTAHHPTASGPKDDVRVAWSHDGTDWFLGRSSPIRIGDVLYAAGDGLLALDAGTGTRRLGVAGPYRSTPASAAASAYTTDTLAVTAPGGVFGLNADGGVDVPVLGGHLGAQRWDGPGPPHGGFPGTLDPPTPVAVDGTVFVPVPETNELVALDANSGEVLWRGVHHEDEPESAEFNRPAVRDGRVFVTNWPKQATAYDAATGERDWRRELDEQFVLPPVATDEGVVVPTRSGARLLDPGDGHTRWNRDLGGNATESTPAVADGAVFVPDKVESLHALDLATGETLWTTPCDGRTAPVVADGVVYAVQSMATLVAFDAATGEKLFEYRPSRVPLSTPIVGDGVLYAAYRDGVVALEEAG